MYLPAGYGGDTKAIEPPPSQSVRLIGELVAVVIGRGVSFTPRFPSGWFQPEIDFIFYSPVWKPSFAIYNAKRPIQWAIFN